MLPLELFDEEIRIKVGRLSSFFEKDGFDSILKVARYHDSHFAQQNKNNNKNKITISKEKNKKQKSENEITNLKCPLQSIRQEI